MNIKIIIDSVGYVAALRQAGIPIGVIAAQ